MEGIRIGDGGLVEINEWQSFRGGVVVCNEADLLCIMYSDKFLDKTIKFFLLAIILIKMDIVEKIDKMLNRGIRPHVEVSNAFDRHFTKTLAASLII